MAQFVFLVHHADALPGHDDHQRPLSPRGELQARRVAEEAARRGARPTAIFHSGKLRARQTAEAWRRGVNPDAAIAEVAGLQPHDDPDAAVMLLVGEDRDIVLASHLPLLPALLHRLATGRRDRLSASFPLNGCVALEKTGELFREAWRIEP